MNATCNTILDYSERHMARAEALLQKTYVLDLVLQSSGYGIALEDENLRLQEAPTGIAAGNRSASGQVALDSGPISGTVTARSAEAALKRTLEVLQGGNDNDSEAEDQHCSDGDVATDGGVEDDSVDEEEAGGIEGVGGSNIDGKDKATNLGNEANDALASVGNRQPQKHRTPLAANAVN